MLLLQIDTSGAAGFMLGRLIGMGLTLLLLGWVLWGRAGRTIVLSLLASVFAVNFLADQIVGPDTWALERWPTATAWWLAGALAWGTSAALRRRDATKGLSASEPGLNTRSHFIYGPLWAWSATLAAVGCLAYVSHFVPGKV